MHSTVVRSNERNEQDRNKPCRVKQTAMVSVVPMREACVHGIEYKHRVRERENKLDREYI